MKPSTRARYALRMMLEISIRSGDGETVNLNSISERTGMPRRYMEQLAMALKGASWIRGIKGESGGYALMQPAEEIYSGQIIEAAIRPINIQSSIFLAKLSDRSLLHSLADGMNVDNVKYKFSPEAGNGHTQSKKGRKNHDTCCER